MIQKQKGFSLVELLIVIGLIGILTAISAPAFQRYIQNTNLRSASRDIASDFLWAKERAVAENDQYQIVVNVGSGSYTISNSDGVVRTKQPSSFGSGITITSAAFGAGTTVTFQTRGIASPLGNIVLTNSRGSTATITTNAAGRVNVQFTYQ